MRAFLFLCSMLMLAVPAAAADRVFRDMDRDGDHILTAGEHAYGSRAMFFEMDKNRDKSVTAAEMTEAQAAITGTEPAPGDLSSEEKIASIDADRNGELSLREHEAGARKMFNRMDMDRNGTLSEAEYAAAQALKKKKKK